MKQSLLSFFVLCLLCMDLAAQMTPATPVPGAGILFRELSFSEALKVAKDENKLIFMDCYTTWCGPCKMLSNVVFKDSTLAEYFNDKFINLKMDMEKGEGIELRKKYEIRGYPTLLFLNANAEVVYRLVGASKAPALLRQVKLGVESGGLTGLQKRYESGQRDSAFIYGYMTALSDANKNKEAEKVAIDFLKGNEAKMLESESYFSIFYNQIHDVRSTPFQYVASHKKEFSAKYPRYGTALDRRLLEDWVNGSYIYRKADGVNQCKADEEGLRDYVALMKGLKVEEADLIAENLRLSCDGVMKQWDSFVKRAERLLASGTILGDDQHLLEWATWLNNSCADGELRGKVAGWCENACKELIKRQEAAKKNLPPGAIPAISMVDYKSKLLQVAEKLRKPMEQAVK